MLSIEGAPLLFSLYTFYFATFPGFSERPHIIMHVEKSEIPTQTSCSVSVDAPKKPMSVALSKDDEIYDV